MAICPAALVRNRHPPGSATVLRCPEPGRVLPFSPTQFIVGKGFLSQSPTRRFNDSRVRFVPNRPPPVGNRRQPPSAPADSAALSAEGRQASCFNPRPSHRGDVDLAIPHPFRIVGYKRKVPQEGVVCRVFCLPAPAPSALVAQWIEQRFLNRVSGVRFTLGAPEPVMFRVMPDIPMRRRAQSSCGCSSGQEVMDEAP